jgi:D-alanyl-D-alanine carboxypeptidase
VEGAAKELLLPGAMVLLQTPQGNFVFGYGTTELGVTNPPRADTHFRPASNTKTMTAAVIVQLVQEGKLGFDDLISKYVQGVPNGDKITIRQLTSRWSRPRVVRSMILARSNSATAPSTVIANLFSGLLT